MILPILYYPNPNLRKIAKPVTAFDETLKTLVADMFDTMYHAKGIGLAATQVDHHLRVVVMDLAGKDEPPAPRLFVNPTFKVLDDTPHAYQEGCLSIPEFYDEIERPKTVEINAQNERGEAFTEVAEGLLAVCIQHEIDHLNGVLFVDYLSRLKQDRARNKVKKVLAKQNK